jgi:hypothetical protein
MKRTELWQKKRAELPVNGNPEADWLEMRSILNKRMPAPHTPKKMPRFKMPKWMFNVFVGVSFIAGVYVCSQLYLTKEHRELVKPGTRQILHDSVAPAVPDISHTPATIKSTNETAVPANAAVITGTAPTIKNQAKLKNDTTPKRERLSIDSIKPAAILNIPRHIDSSLMLMQAIPQKALRDSAGAVNIGKKNIQKDTSNNDRKTLKKKKRSKFSVFF